MPPTYMDLIKNNLNEALKAQSLDMKGGFFPFFQVMGLQIVDQLERGLECRYEISDEDGGAIYFTCQEISILEVSEVI